MNADSPSQSSAPVAGAQAHERVERHSRLYRIARATCAIIILSVVALDVISIPTAYTALQSPCSPCDSDALQLTVGQMRALQASSVDVQMYVAYKFGLIAVTQFSFIGLGLLLFIRRSDDRMALFTSLMLTTFGGAAFTGTLHALPTVNDTFWLPVYLLNVTGQVSFFMFSYLFPNGRLIPRWTIIPAAIWFLGWALPAVRIPTLDAYANAMSQGWLFVVLVLTVVVAQAYRYQRVSSPHERQQTKWVVYGVVLCLTIFLTTIIVGNLLLSESIRDSPLGTLVFNTITYLVFLLIPASIAIAILRSRLYDIDVIINRTLVYGSLTAILAALYFALVLGAQTLTHLVTGRQTQSPVVIVLSTLVIAALFQPLRARLQRTIDRRFYRSRYDAAKTLATFSATLRQEVDLRELNERLLSVVEETMQPEHVSLWLRPDQAKHKEWRIE